MDFSEKTMFAWLKRLFDRSTDPVYSCDLYRDKSAGSCAHVDGPLCDFPKCSMLADYRQQKEDMTIAGDAFPANTKVLNTLTNKIRCGN